MVLLPPVLLFSPTSLVFGSGVQWLGAAHRDLGRDHGNQDDSLLRG
jgi:hypothetical protein